jgi:hypothetical protein
MPFHVISCCPHCASESPFLSEQIGENVFCPKCGKSMTVENSNPVQVVQGKKRRNKTIFRLVISTVTILIIVLIIGIRFGSTEKKAIEAVIAKDRAISESIGTPRSISEAKKSLASMVEQMQQIDLSDCPEDFRVAYQKHINAWTNAYQAFQKIPNRIWEWPFWKIFTGYNLKEEEKLIDDTWFEVKNIAIKYKVNVQDKLSEESKEISEDTSNTQ